MSTSRVDCSPPRENAISLLLNGKSVICRALNALGLPEGSLRSLLHRDTHNDH